MSSQLRKTVNMNEVQKELCWQSVEKPCCQLFTTPHRPRIPDQQVKSEELSHRLWWKQSRALFPHASHTSHPTANSHNSFSCLRSLSRPPWPNSTQKPYRKATVSGEYFCRRSVNWLSLVKGPVRCSWFKVENGSGQLGETREAILALLFCHVKLLKLAAGHFAPIVTITKKFKGKSSGEKNQTS